MVADFSINIAALDQDAREWNRIAISLFTHIFSENRFPFCASAALRVRIMR
jgi:hypothetical protein